MWERSFERCNDTHIEGLLETTGRDLVLIQSIHTSRMNGLPPTRRSKVRVLLVDDDKDAVTSISRGLDAEVKGRGKLMHLLTGATGFVLLSPAYSNSSRTRHY